MWMLKSVILRDVIPYSFAQGYTSLTPMQFQNLQDKMGGSMLTHNVIVVWQTTGVAFRRLEE